MARADSFIWSGYKVADDVAGWVHTFAAVAQTYPACIVISDMTIPGNPMFFVNDEFCRVTGYSLSETHGRNCRFLQGPKTEPQSVAVIQDTLRRGVDCHVKITNYRKSGELFENLLTMRPVHDSNGVYRFCIGVQFEVEQGQNLKSRLSKLDKLLKLLPSTLEVSGTRIGAAHQRCETMEETQTSLEVKLQKALSGNPVRPRANRMHLNDPSIRQPRKHGPRTAACPALTKGTHLGAPSIVLLAVLCRWARVWRAPWRTPPPTGTTISITCRVSGKSRTART